LDALRTSLLPLFPLLPSRSIKKRMGCTGGKEKPENGDGDKAGKGKGGDKAPAAEEPCASSFHAALLSRT